MNNKKFPTRREVFGNWIRNIPKSQFLLSIVWVIGGMLFGSTITVICVYYVTGSKLLSLVAFIVVFFLTTLEMLYHAYLAEIE